MVQTFTCFLYGLNVIDELKLEISFILSLLSEERKFACVLWEVCIFFEQYPRQSLLEVYKSLLDGLVESRMIVEQWDQSLVWS